MNYKKIFKNQKLRFIILKFLSFIPDKQMIKLQYKVKTGRKLNVDNPQRFSEKMQIYKLKYRNPIMRQCVDKYGVRKYVESKGLKHILNELYGIYDSPTKIEFDKLPNKFVLKTTLGSGGHNVYICKDKSTLNVLDVKKKLKAWQKEYNKKSYGREWAYDNGNNRIIAEKYIESDDLIDYKFFTFKGEVNYIYAISNRKMGEFCMLGIYDKDFKKIKAYRMDEMKQTKSLKKPEGFDEMKKYASVLSKDFPQARIDFYNTKGKIIFGEITFYDGSGYVKFEPDSFDFEFGKKFDIGDME